MPSKKDPAICYDDELKAHVRFENASDAILARLALGLGIDGPALTSFISAVRNPAFNPSEVTFKNSDDIYLQLAQIRRREEALVCCRSQGTQDSIPDVVVDGVIDMLKAEFHEAILAFRAKDEGFGFTTWDFPLDRVGSECFELLRQRVSVAKEHISICALVHSSWLPKARRALGSALISRLGTKAPLSRAVRNPCFGEWTLEVELEADAKGSLYPLVALFSRLPNVRLLRLSLTNSHAISQEQSDFFRERKDTVIRNALNCLSQLEDLSLIMTGFEPGIFRPDFISLPLLKRIRLVGLRAGYIIDDEASNPILQLVTHVLPSLQRLSVGPRTDDRTGRPGLQIAFISWRKVREADGESPPKFVPEKVDCVVKKSSYQPTEDDRKVLSKTRYLRLCCDQKCSTTINGIWAVLESATSISTLVLCAHKTDTGTNALAALQRVSRSIEELQLILPSWSDEGRWEVWDQAVYETLSIEPRRYPKLHSLKMVFSTTTLEEDDYSTFADLINCLPSSRDWCGSHGVKFESLRDDRLRLCCELYL